MHVYGLSQRSHGSRRYLVYVAPVAWVRSEMEVAVANATVEKTNEWVDRQEYPFKPNYLSVDGGRMHYVDEGIGSPVVFIHGSPTWSFMYRRMIRDLSMRHRCIAPDLIGFGLSEKPSGWSYSPQAQALNISHLLDSLDLQDITLVVHDFGGPIGLSYAIANPPRVRALVIMNSWLWSLSENSHARKIDHRARNPIGRIMYQANHPVNVEMPRAFADRLKFPDKVHEQYKGPFANSKERGGPHGLAKSILAAGPWYSALLAQREKLQDKQALIIWGLQDPMLGADSLARWRNILPNARVEELNNGGHFVAEECPTAVEAAAYMFVDGLSQLHASRTTVATEIR